MKHYRTSVEVIGGAIIDLTVKAPDERLAIAAVKRKDSIRCILSLTEVEAPASMLSANKRHWVVQAKDMAGDSIEIFVTATSQSNVRTKMSMHSRCAQIVRVDETCKSDWEARKAKKI